VAPKRGGQDDVHDAESRIDQTPIMAGALRVGETMNSPVPEKKEEEKISLFWRVFGGTILSIAALISITLFNNMNSSINDLRAESAKSNEARNTAVMELRTEMAKSNETRSELVRKEDYNSRMSSQWERVQTLQQQNSQQNALLTSLKTELDGMKERLSKFSNESDGVKRDLAGMELVKERLTLVVADLKLMREDHQKLRNDSDKNQAYDLERKQQRDTQYKQIDDTLKDLQKALQDCREKIARLEGPYGPPSPIPVKKEIQSRPTPMPKPEKAPTPAVPKTEPSTGEK